MFMELCVFGYTIANFWILDALHGAAKRLNHLGRAMGQEVDTQNKHIERITGKTDKVDDQIAMNRARLDRIK